MTLMRLDENFELDADFEKITELVKKFEEGDRSDEAKEAWLFSVIYDFGYESAVLDWEEAKDRALLMLSGTGGNA